MPPTASTTLRNASSIRRQPSASTRAVSFLDANRWQRECLQLGSEGYDGFVVLVGLFLVLLVENLWTFDPSTFVSEISSDAFLTLLVTGTAFGLFTIFSITLIKLKVQRLLTRDIYALKIYQSPENAERRNVHLDRISRRWEESRVRQAAPASISYEWYHGARDEYKGKWDPRRPRSLVAFAALSFVAMIATSLSALAVRLADAKGAWWGVWTCVGVGSGILLPAFFVSRSVKAPPEMGADETNPFQGVG